MKTDAWTLIRYLHILGLAFFVGGQLVLAVAVVPALRGGEETLMRSVARRFGIASITEMPRWKRPASECGHGS